MAGSCKLTGLDIMWVFSKMHVLGQQRAFFKTEVVSGMAKVW